jgi:hypothetical protein
VREVLHVEWDPSMGPPRHRRCHGMTLRTGRPVHS